MAKIIRKRQVKIVLSFLFVLIVFVIIRAPYREIKIYVIQSLARRVGIEISLTDSRLALPLGIELENLIIKTDTPKTKFISPRIDKLSLQLEAATIFSGARSINFEILNGGTGKGNLFFDNESLVLQLVAADLNIAGLQYGNQFKVKKGEISIDGNIDINSNILTGNASVSASGNSLLIYWSSPFLPEILVDRFSITANKKNKKIDLRISEMSGEGIKLEGQGKITLNEQLPGSRINLKAKVEIKNGENGALGSYLPFLEAFSGRKKDINVTINGRMFAPRISVNGKKVM